MKKPLISIIVPVYNTAALLPRGIESILEQTHQNIEILLIDDGSTDDCRHICDNFAQKDQRIQVIHQANAGVSAARNAGLNAANGEWIGFMDSDDWIAPDMYAKLLEAAMKHHKLIAVCGFVKHHLDGQIENRTFEKLPGSIPASTALTQAISGYYYEGFMVNKLFHRTLFTAPNAMRFDPSLHCCEDLVLVVQLLLATDGIACTPEGLYHYVMREDSSVNVFSEKRLSEITARKRVITLTKAMPLAKVRYVQSVVGLLYHAAQCGSTAYFTVLRREALRYGHLYFLSSAVSLQMKLRSAAILINPRMAYWIWDRLKKYFGLRWWRREINS